MRPRNVERTTHLWVDRADRGRFARIGLGRGIRVARPRSPRRGARARTARRMGRPLSAGFRRDRLLSPDDGRIAFAGCGLRWKRASVPRDHVGVARGGSRSHGHRWRSSRALAPRGGSRRGAFCRAPRDGAGRIGHRVSLRGDDRGGPALARRVSPTRSCRWGGARLAFRRAHQRNGSRSRATLRSRHRAHPVRRSFSAYTPLSLVPLRGRGSGVGARVRPALRRGPAVARDVRSALVVGSLGYQARVARQKRVAPDRPARHEHL